MGLSRLSVKCRECSFVEKCKHKKMEALYYLEPAGMPAAMEAPQPLLVPHDYRNIKVAENTTVTIDVEKLKKDLVQSHFPNMGLDYGA